MVFKSHVLNMAYDKILDPRLALTSKHRYSDTIPGRIDSDMVRLALTLKGFWGKRPGEPISVAQLFRLVPEVDAHSSGCEQSAIERMVRKRLLKLTTKGQVVVPGEDWCENDDLTAA